MSTLAQRSDARLETGPRGGGDRFVAVGLLLLAALFATIQILAGELIPPLAVPALLYAGIGGVLLRVTRRWLVLTTVALIVVHLATSIPFLVAALAHPESPASFLPDAFIVIVALAVVVGALAGLRGSGSRRHIWVAAALLATALTVGSVVAASGVDSDVRQAGDVPIETVRSSFPARVQVPAGSAALWVDNQDAFRHTLVIEGTDVHAELPGSTAVRVETDLAPGTYRYFCDVPGHERMAGELVVR